MKVLIDISHPAHVHFFRNPLRSLRAHGHELLVTSRAKEMTLDLLHDLGMEHIELSAQRKTGVLSLAQELAIRDFKLHRIVRQDKPDILAAIGGTVASHVGWITRTPSIVFYDTANATLQNALTYPFASRVVVPRCYTGWVPAKRSIRYDGYHELSYLHPDYFVPDRNKAVSNGLAPEGDTFIIRLVGWAASHDIGERGLNDVLLERIVGMLESHGTVLISSERPLPTRLSAYRYQGNPVEIHHVMAFCRAYVGESATMASECAVLGVPAVYCAETGRVYTDEQEERYGLVRNISTIDWKDLEPAVSWALTGSKTYFQQARMKLLEDTIDVARFVTDCIETFPAAPRNTLQS